MKTLSVRQPWANLIVHGIKDIENRNWRTNFRGRIYIHAPAKSDIGGIVFTEDQFSEISMNPLFHYRDCEASAIVGTVNILDCIPDSESVWAEKECWHWVLSDPILFDEPILNVKGKLSLWEYVE